MNKNQKHFQKIVEEEIEILIEELKPEIKKRFGYVFRENIKRDNNSTITAETHQYLNPKMIIFYTNAISEVYYSGLKKWMKEIIKHEVAHLFTENEKEAAKKEKAFNIFKI